MAPKRTNMAAGRSKSARAGSVAKPASKLSSKDSQRIPKRAASDATPSSKRGRNVTKPGSKSPAKDPKPASKRVSKETKPPSKQSSKKNKPVTKLSSKDVSITKVSINRAPVLTLWAALVAQGLGHDEGSSLTFGKAVAGFAAIGKGRSLGLMGPAKGGKATGGTSTDLTKQGTVSLCGMQIPVAKTKEGQRAIVQGVTADPFKVSAYLTKAFGETLPDVHAAFTKLVRSLSKSELQNSAFAIYQQIRPSVDKGAAGWGQRGTLDLAQVLRMAGGE